MTDKNLEYGIHFRSAYEKLPRQKTFPTEEDMACEAQLSALGVWEPLKFSINNNQWRKDFQKLEQYWVPFQPWPGKQNDRQSVLVYGPDGANPSDSCGLSQLAKKYGKAPSEDSMIHPTKIKDELESMSEVFNYFDLGRTFVINLNAGGHYPPHRDQILLTRPTFRLIAFLGNNTSSNLRWEVEDNLMRFETNHIYYVDTRKTHRLWSSAPNSTMIVFNVFKNWKNVMRLMTKLKYQGG